MQLRRLCAPEFRCGMESFPQFVTTRFQHIPQAMGIVGASQTALLLKCAPGGADAAKLHLPITPTTAHVSITSLIRVGRVTNFFRLTSVTFGPTPLRCETSHAHPLW